MIGIYKITSPMGRFYIGQSRDIERRFATYKRLSCKSQPKLYASLVKYGVNNHYFEVLVECEESELNYYETFYIRQNQSFRSQNLNCRMDGIYQMASDETRKKISEINKGRVVSEETRLKLSLNAKGKPSPNKGKKVAPEIVQKQRIKLIEGGKVKGPNNPFYGKTHSEANLSKMRGKSKGVGGLNNTAKLVINTETGMFYDCIKDAAESILLKPYVLSKMLRGDRKNKTSFIYA